MSDRAELWKVAATVLSGTLAGALAFVSFADAPVLHKLAREDEGMTKRFFAVWWPTAANMMAPLVAVAAGSNLLAYAASSDRVWLATGVGVALILPYTFLVMGGDIATLRQPEAKNVAPAVSRFTFRHHLRTVAATVVFGVCVKQLAGL